MAIVKGQNLRIFVGTSGSEKCIGMAKDCTINLELQTEDSSTKDSTGDWAEAEAVGKSWSVSCNSIVYSDTDATGQNTASLIGLFGTKVSLKWDITNGDKNRTGTNASGIKKSGEAWMTKCSIQASNRQSAQGSFEFQGTGALS